MDVLRNVRRAIQTAVAHRVARHTFWQAGHTWSNKANSAIPQALPCHGPTGCPPKLMAQHVIRRAHGSWFMAPKTTYMLKGFLTGKRKHIQQQFPHKNSPQSPRQLLLLCAVVYTYYYYFEAFAQAETYGAKRGALAATHCMPAAISTRINMTIYLACSFLKPRIYRRAYQLTVGRAAGGAATVLSAMGRAAGRAAKAAAERATSILREAFMAEFMMPAGLIFSSLPSVVVANSRVFVQRRWAQSLSRAPKILAFEWYADFFTEKYSQPLSPIPQRLF